MRTVLLAACALLSPILSAPAATQLKAPVIEPLSQKAPAFQYRSLDGKVHRLSELRGKVVVIDFWGTWCAGCVEEMPTIEHLYNSYRSDPGVAFVIVSQRDSADKVKAFVQKNHLALPIYYIGSDTPAKPLAHDAWPTTYFVSPDGVVRGMYSGGGDWSDPSVRKYIDHLQEEYPSRQSR